MGRRWRTPVGFLVLASVAMPFGFAAWQALLNNFAIERAAFTGREIGILQSLREVPGFLAFTAVFVILVLRELVLREPAPAPSARCLQNFSIKPPLFVLEFLAG